MRQPSSVASQIRNVRCLIEEKRWTTELTWYGTSGGSASGCLGQGSEQRAASRVPPTNEGVHSVRPKSGTPLSELEAESVGHPTGKVDVDVDVAGCTEAFAGQGPVVGCPLCIGAVSSSEDTTGGGIGCEAVCSTRLGVCGCAAESGQVGNGKGSVLRGRSRNADNALFAIKASRCSDVRLAIAYGAAVCRGIAGGSIRQSPPPSQYGMGQWPVQHVGSPQRSNGTTSIP